MKRTRRGIETDWIVDAVERIEDDFSPWTDELGISMGDPSDDVEKPNASR